MTSVRRAEALNDHPLFIDALADLVHAQLQRLRRGGDATVHASDAARTPARCPPLNQLPLRCIGCTNDVCADMRRFFLA